MLSSSRYRILLFLLISVLIVTLTMFWQEIILQHIKLVRVDVMKKYQCTFGSVVDHNRNLKHDLVTSIITAARTSSSGENCENKNPAAGKWGSKIVFLIHSAPENDVSRDVLRKHAAAFGVHMMFVLGKSEKKKKPETLSNSMRDLETYSDVIVGPFIDSYYNLTLKHLFGLSHVLNKCSNVDFVVKADDDIFINFDEVKRVIEFNYPRIKGFTGKRNVPKRLLAGYTFQGMSVSRDPEDKWCVTREEYMKSEYPFFVSGWGYITTIPTIRSLITAVETMGNRSDGREILWIDDVFVTGFVREAANEIMDYNGTNEDRIVMDEFAHKYTLSPDKLIRWSDREIECKWDYMFSNTDGNSGNILTRAYDRLQQDRHLNELIPCSLYHSERIIFQKRIS